MDVRALSREYLGGLRRHAGGVILLLAFVPSHASAVCTISQPLLHALGTPGSVLQNCAEPANGFAYARTIPNPILAHSSDIDIVCDQAFVATPQSAVCQSGAGTANDGYVTVNFQWGGSGGVVGCPNPTGVAGIGRNFVHVVANDGSAVVLSVGYNTVLAAYVVEAAHPYDQPTGAYSPLSCGAPGTRALTIEGLSSGGGVDVTVSAPLIFTDCDPGSGGVVFGTCTEGTGPLTALGNIYSRVAACGSMPDLSLASGWNFVASPAPDGSANLALPDPDPNCLLLAATYTMAGEESPAVAGFDVISPGYCSDSDMDGISDCEGDCSDLDPDVFPGQTESCNGVDDDCNGFIDDDAGGLDADGDTVPNACDNCRVTPNRSQADADSDGEGDLCDLDDGLFVVEFLDPDTLIWHDEPEFQSFNLYRSDLLFMLASAIYTQDPGLVPMAMHECRIPDAQFTESFAPPLGQAVIYWITGRSGGSESSLDTNSFGDPRPNDNPC